MSDMTITTHKRPICWTNRHLRRVSPLLDVGQISPPSIAPGRLSEMMQAVDKSTPQVGVVSDFVPVMDYKKYISMLEDANHPRDLIKTIRQKHEDYYDTHCQYIPSTRPVLPDIPDLIYTDSKVNGCIPFINFNKCTPRETLPMYIEAGVDAEYIKSIEQNIKKWERSIPGRNKIVDEVLSKYSGKPPARKKKKSLRSRFVRRTVGLVKDEEVDNDKAAE